MSRPGLILAAAVFLSACQAPVHQAQAGGDIGSWNPAGAASRVAEYLVDPLPARLPARPWAGTVSHHLLTAPLIDCWYANLQKYGPYRTIIILSPKHSAQGAQEISFSDRDWQEGGGLMRADGRLARRLARSLGVPMDHAAFYHEHGVGAQIPFLRRHFPRSRIVPILLEETHRRSDLLARLSQQLLPILARRRDVLLVLSTDFTHHADPDKLERSDARTYAFFRRLSVESSPLAGCDSRAGILVVSLLAEGLQRRNALILAQADSGRLSSVREDMTSYFFTYFY